MPAPRTQKAKAKRDAKTIALHERQAMVVSLRKQGANWTQIAKAISAKRDKGELTEVPEKYGRTHAYRDAHAALARWTTPQEEEAEMLRRIWQERLEEIFSKIYPLAKRGELFSIDRIIAILGQEAKLNPGLFPKDGQVDVNVKGQVGVGGVTEQGEVAGPVRVVIEWPDVPNDNTVGFADPSDPATMIEITKMLKGALGATLGAECAELVIAHLSMAATSGAEPVQESTDNDSTAQDVAGIFGGAG